MALSIKIKKITLKFDNSGYPTSRRKTLQALQITLFRQTCYILSRQYKTCYIHGVTEVVTSGPFAKDRCQRLFVKKCETVFTALFLLHFIDHNMCYIVLVFILSLFSLSVIFISFFFYILQLLLYCCYNIVNIKM